MRTSQYGLIALFLAASSCTAERATAPVVTTETLDVVELFDGERVCLGDEGGGDCDPMIKGRMTGGGGQLIVGDVFVSRGFTIHCDITRSNNLEINWPGNRWHIDKPLTSAICIDDPNFSPVPPRSPFDTFIGEGIGRLNGIDGSLVRFRFVDTGERGGQTDLASIQIYDAAGVLVLDVPLSLLTHGNIQAHENQPHK
jgi:hypothetical protein